MYINKKNQHVIELGYILMTEMSYHQVCHIITSQFLIFFCTVKKRFSVTIIFLVFHPRKKIEYSLRPDLNDVGVIFQKRP
jgi:hypothetical protein